MPNMASTATREQVMAYFKKASQASLDPDSSNNRDAAQDSTFRANLASLLGGHNAAPKPTQMTAQMIAPGTSGKTTTSNNNTSG